MLGANYIIMFLVQFLIQLRGMGQTLLQAITFLEVFWSFFLLLYTTIPFWFMLICFYSKYKSLSAWCFFKVSIAMCFETEYHIPTLICCEDIVIWTHRQQQAIYVGKKVFQLSIFSGIDDNPHSQSNCCQA